jgi:hypothetical protein
MPDRKSHLQVLKETATLITPYFIPSCANLWRCTSSLLSVIAIPASTFLVTFLMKKYEEDNDSTNNLVDLLISALSLSIVTGVNNAFTYSLNLSLKQAIKKDNLKLLLEDEGCALLNANYRNKVREDNNGVTSIQYVTIGRGVDEFTEGAVGLFIKVPSLIITITTSLTQISLIISHQAALYTFAFAGGAMLVVSSVAMFANNNEIFIRNVENNELISQISALEGNR